MSSPDDRKQSLRKVTYLGGKKRKRVLSTPADADSDSSSASKRTKSSVMDTPSPKETVVKSSSRKGPKKVDVDLPGPSPIKQVEHDNDASVKPTKAAKGRSRKAASTPGPSLKDIVQQVADSPKPESKKRETPGTPKPESTSVVATPKPKSSRAKSIAAEEDFDDNASVADSIISVTRTRRNEGERIEYFKNQPECGTLEPRAAQCTRCGKMVNLGRKQTYAVRPWELHRVRCDQKPAQVPPATPAPVEQPTSSSEAFAELAAIAVTPFKPASTQAPARRPSEQDRKAFLESEKQIKQLEKNRALCAKCDQWIALSDATAYTSGNWMKHKTKCFDIVPSNRVAAAKRKLLLVNDRQVKSFTSRTVDCNNCGISVPLEGEGDFNLTAWDAHKVQCTKSIPIPRNESLNGITFPSISSRTPLSSGTLATPGTTASLPQGSKRPREEADAVHEEEQPAVRQRTETYEPPRIEPPNTLLGWFMLPFNSIARGFKESLKDRS